MLPLFLFPLGWLSVDDSSVILWYCVNLWLLSVVPKRFVYCCFLCLLRLLWKSFSLGTEQMPVLSQFLCCSSYTEVVSCTGYNLLRGELFCYCMPAWASTIICVRLLLLGFVRHWCGPTPIYLRGYLRNE